MKNLQRTPIKLCAESNVSYRRLSLFLSRYALMSGLGEIKKFYHCSVFYFTMCRKVTVLIECFCSNRIIEIHNRTACNCLQFSFLNNIKAVFCLRCEQDLVCCLKKCADILIYFDTEKEKLFYINDPRFCYQQVFI